MPETGTAFAFSSLFFLTAMMLCTWLLLIDFEVAECLASSCLPGKLNRVMLWNLSP